MIVCVSSRKPLLTYSVAAASLLWALIQPVAALAVSGFGLPADFDVDGVRLHRELVDCRTVNKDDTMAQCRERITFRGQLIEERVLLISPTGVWLVAEIDPLAREVEEYEPYIPLMLFYETGVASGGYTRYDTYQGVLERGMWSADLIFLGYDPNLPIRKYQALIQFTSQDLKRYRRVELVFLGRVGW